MKRRKKKGRTAPRRERAPARAPGIEALIDLWIVPVAFALIGVLLANGAIYAGLAAFEGEQVRGESLAPISPGAFIEQLSAQLVWLVPLAVGVGLVLVRVHRDMVGSRRGNRRRHAATTLVLIVRGVAYTVAMVGKGGGIFLGNVAAIGMVGAMLISKSRPGFVVTLTTRLLPLGRLGRIRPFERVDPTTFVLWTIVLTIVTGGLIPISAYNTVLRLEGTTLFAAIMSLALGDWLILNHVIELETGPQPERQRSTRRRRNTQGLALDMNADDSSAG